MMQIFMIGTTLVCGFLVATIIYRRKMLMPVKKCFTALFFFFFSVIVTAQVQPPENKIDPAFRFLISNVAKLKDSAAFRNFPQLFKLRPFMVEIPGKQAPEERYDCIIYTTQNPQILREKGIVIQAVLPRFVTAWVTLEQIQVLATLPEVKMIEAPRLNEGNNDVAVAGSGASLLHAGRLNNTPYKGKGVIAAIFDSGIDWDHPDFRDPVDTNKSRILRIWDQTLTPIAGESAPTALGFNYGVEYTQNQINNELDGTPTGYVREQDGNGHGTHVAGTFAGNGAAIPLTRKHTGMAPEADIVIIKGGNGSYSTTNTINAISYLQALATQLGKPVVLNMSIGSIYGPHDGSLSYETAIDNFTASAPGRAVVVAAGNSNGTRNHNRLLMGPAGIGNVTFTVPTGTNGSDVFAYRLYVNDNSTLTATLTAPDGTAVTALPNQTVTTLSLAAGFNMNVYNYIDVANNDRYIEVYVTRNGSSTASPAGIWTLGLTNTTNNSLTLDGWLYYTNGEYAGTILGNSDNEYMTGSPGNANSAIAVGAFVGRPAWYSYGAAGNYLNTAARQDSIAVFSSHGPRRDEVLKPELAANGQHVISALSSNSNPEASDIVFNGSYTKSQGTSMSSPVVAGAMALLLQANPTATIAQLRNAIFNNTTKDALTEGVSGPTPNPVWGYGRLDAYKAVSTMFNCTPVNRKTFQHDASNFPTQDAGVNQTNTRVSVRYTPDITGKLGGAYFHTSGAKTALVLEVRTSNAGAPGTLLGTMNLPDTTIALYSWNYVDLSSLNISVTSGNDYFVIVYRNANSNDNWSLRRENTNVDNRSLVSPDGATWSNPGVDYKIRSVVYSNVQITGPVAATNSANTRDINTSNQFINGNCQLIAQLVPAGTAPVNGTVTANVWIEPGIPRITGGGPFVARHYQLTPPVATSTGRVTLYFTQDDFTAFNNDIASTSDLPNGPTDVVGKTNLLIGKFSGNSGDGSGLPGTYSGSATIIDPDDADIVWNTDANRWEVTFAASNLGGFIVQTKTTVLPVSIIYFSGVKQGSTHVLDWKLNCGNSDARFEIQRSSDGVNFHSIGNIAATQVSCQQPFTFSDKNPLGGVNYYRIKITENSGRIYYTNIIQLQSERLLTTSIYPTYIKKGATVQVSFAGTEGSIVMNDATGKQVYAHTLRNGVQAISLPELSTGIYFYRIIENNKNRVAGGKLVVE